MWNSDRSRRQTTAVRAILPNCRLQQGVTVIVSQYNATQIEHINFGYPKKWKKVQTLSGKLSFSSFHHGWPPVVPMFPDHGQQKAVALERRKGNFTTQTEFCEGIPWLNHDFLELSRWVSQVTSLQFTQIGRLIPWFQGLLKDWRQPSITPSCYAAYAPKTETQIPERKWHLTNLVERFERLCPNLDGRIFVGPFKKELMLRFYNYPPRN